ncbi:hypothetical protein [Gymnodinialimonas hymeniacidonis]|uniref:hypothetical protein n=1 Tax=Gymnodinialimonas hymeniacidonis TaxID=3126508 RepID=UPI0034C68D34
MKKIALIAAVAATVAAPAFAQSAASVAAIQHFNMFEDNALERTNVNGVGQSVSPSGALGQTFEILNSDQDVASDLRGVNGATLVNGQPAYGADIFDRLRAASLEDE